MQRVQRTHLVFLVVGLALLAGCETKRAAAGTRPEIPSETMQHGVQVGVRLASLDLHCTDAIRRVVSPASGVQLVTFATPYDCSSCSPHLAGLDNLKNQGKLPRDEMIVVWGSPRDLASMTSAKHAASPRPVCIDSSGVFWDRDNVSHTPFTVLLVNGRIAYVNDRLLAEQALSDAFEADLAAYGAQ